MTAITGVDGNSVYIPVPFMQISRYTLTRRHLAEMPKMMRTGWGDGGHTSRSRHFRADIAA